MTSPVRAIDGPAPGFIKTLRQARVTADIPQRDLAAQLGWSQERLTRYESGYAAIHPRILTEWAAALGYQITAVPAASTESSQA